MIDAISTEGILILLNPRVNARLTIFTIIISIVTIPVDVIINCAGITIIIDRVIGNLLYAWIDGARLIITVRTSRATKVTISILISILSIFLTIIIQAVVIDLSSAGVDVGVPIIAILGVTETIAIQIIIWGVSGAILIDAVVGNLGGAWMHIGVVVIAVPIRFCYPISIRVLLERLAIFTITILIDTVSRDIAPLRVDMRGTIITVISPHLPGRVTVPIDIIIAGVLITIIVQAVVGHLRLTRMYIGVVVIAVPISVADSITVIILSPTGHITSIAVLVDAIATVLAAVLLSPWIDAGLTVITIFTQLTALAIAISISIRAADDLRDTAMLLVTVLVGATVLILDTLNILTGVLQAVTPPCAFSMTRAALLSTACTAKSGAITALSTWAALLSVTLSGPTTLLCADLTVGTLKITEAALDRRWERGIRVWVGRNRKISRRLLYPRVYAPFIEGWIIGTTHKEQSEQREQEEQGGHISLLEKI